MEGTSRKRPRYSCSDLNDDTVEELIDRCDVITSASMEGSFKTILDSVNTLQKKDTAVTFWAERIFFCHTYDTSMTIIVTKPGIIIDVVGSYFYDKKL